MSISRQTVDKAGQQEHTSLASVRGVFDNKAARERIRHINGRTYDPRSSEGECQHVKFCHEHQPADCGLTRSNKRRRHEHQKAKQQSTWQGDRHHQHQLVHARQEGQQERASSASASTNGDTDSESKHHDMRRDTFDTSRAARVTSKASAGGSSSRRTCQSEHREYHLVDCCPKRAGESEHHVHQLGELFSTTGQ